MNALARAMVHAQHRALTPNRTNFAALPLPTPSDWTRRAACVGWIELDWTDPNPELTVLYRSVCAGCPVRDKCLLTALVTGEPWGIWGGLDTDERAALARYAGFPPPKPLPSHGVHARYVRHGCRCDACRHGHALYERQRRRARRLMAAAH